MKINEIRPHPDNPQKYTDEDLQELINSIRDFPEMMRIRPIVYDPKTMYILGGNKRWQALKKMGYTSIPDKWLRAADNLTEKEKKRFILQDNIQIGTWDTELLFDKWDNELLADLGFDTIMEEEAKSEFEKEFNKYDDNNAEMPIVPQYDERYTYFVIFITNKEDEQIVRKTFGLTEKFRAGKKNDQRLSTVIPIEKIRELWKLKS